MVSSNFSCSYTDLADVFRLAGFEYQEHQASFAAYKPSKYPPQYGEENARLLQAFLNLVDPESFSKQIQAARETYVNDVKGVSILFKTLKSFIGELTTDKAKLANFYKDAGQQLFNDRSANDLDDNIKALSAMARFVQTNQTDLSAKDLPATFVQQLKDKQTSLTTTNAAWLAEKAVAAAAIEAKNIAGNELKARMSDMFLDAQTMFQDQKEIAKKFVFETLLAKVRAGRNGGIVGKTTNKATEKGVGNITISISSLNLSVVSGDDGRYELPPIPAGIYDIEAKGEGFKTVVIEKRVVKAGVTGRLTIEMEGL